MPLVLNFKEGDDFYADSNRLVVERIWRGGTVRINNGTNHVDVTQEKYDEVFPGVSVRVSNVRMGKLAIDAPGMFLLNGNAYRAKKAQA